MTYPKLVTRQDLENAPVTVKVVAGTERRGQVWIRWRENIIFPPQLIAEFDSNPNLVKNESREINCVTYNFNPTVVPVENLKQYISGCLNLHSLEHSYVD